MQLFGFGFGRSSAYPLGLMAHEVAKLSLRELRGLFGATCVDVREYRANGDRDIPRTAGGAIDGVVAIVEVGIRIAPARGVPTYVTWTEVFGGLSLIVTRELLAQAQDLRGTYRAEPPAPIVHVDEVGLEYAA